MHHVYLSVLPRGTCKTTSIDHCDSVGVSGVDSAGCAAGSLGLPVWVGVPVVAEFVGLGPWRGPPAVLALEYLAFYHERPPERGPSSFCPFSGNPGGLPAGSGLPRPRTREQPEASRQLGGSPRTWALERQQVPSPRILSAASRGSLRQDPPAELPHFLTHRNHVM